MAIKYVEAIINGKRQMCQFNPETGLYTATTERPTGSMYTVRAVDFAGNEALRMQRAPSTNKGLRIDGIRIKNPNQFNPEYYTLTKSTRVANGNMVMDYVANKQKFNLTWNAIDSRELDKIIEILWRSLPTTKECFHWLDYEDDLREYHVRIYAGAIPHNLHRGDGKLWVWKDVKISLIER